MISNDEFSKIFSRNLRRIMYEREISQSKMAQDLNIPKTTISGWVNAKRTPKMDKIDQLCTYLRCTRTDLMEPPGSNLSRIVSGVKIPVL